MAGHDFDDAADSIELAAPAMRQSRQEGTLRRWLEALPDRGLRRPARARHRAWSARGWRPATRPASNRCSQLVESTLRPVGTVADRLRHRDVRPAPRPSARAPRRPRPARRRPRRHRSPTPPARSTWSNRPTTSAAAARPRCWPSPTGPPATSTPAVRRYTEAISEFIAADHLPDMLGCSLALADIQIAQGKLADAKRTFDSGLRWTTEHPGLRGAADMHVGLSEVLIERNDLDAAARHLETSNELGESAGLPQHAYRWRVAMARLCRARGDLDGALELIDEAAPLYDTDFSPPVRPVAAIRARVQLGKRRPRRRPRVGHRTRPHRRRRTQLRPRVRAHHTRPGAHRPPRSRADSTRAR